MRYDGVAQQELSSDTLQDRTKRGQYRASVRELTGDWVVFRDYVMEGWVEYELRLRSNDPLPATLEVRLMGTNRDGSLESHIRWQLR